MTTTIYTVGHGTKTTEEFVEVLASVVVQRLVDVRRYPGSRLNPQFSRPALEKSLPAMKGSSTTGGEKRLADDESI